MAEQKILLVTADAAFSEAVIRAFPPAEVLFTVVPAWQKFPVQNKPMYALLLLDMDTLGMPKIADLKAVVTALRGLPVISLCDIRTTNRDTVEYLGGGANDAISKNTPPPLLAAKVRAHLRRGMNNDRAAGAWLR